MSTSKKENSESKTTTGFLLMMGMSTAFLLVAPVLILLTIGYFLDIYFHTKPTLMLVGIGIGLIGGMINVFRLLQAMQKVKR
jgi:ATP synthase protein I